LRSAERRERLQIDRVVGYCLAASSVETVLDVGTGTGLFAEAFQAQGLKVRAVDCNQTIHDAAASLVPGVDFRQASAEKLPFDKGQFDLVFMGHLLHETDDAAAAMAEAFRVSRRRLAVLEWPYIDQEIGPPLAHRMPLEKITSLGVRAGFALYDVIQLKLMQLVIFDR
jgi:ubiquinone/menaquinone biosynthesis C-methylase UbiE